MKKSVAIMIAIIFVASILVINLFGLKMSVYNETFPVTKIECINKEGNGVTIKSTLYPVDGATTPINQWKRIPVINIKYNGPANANDNTGTMFFIETRVYPDNATEKRVQFINYSNSVDAELYVDASGNPNGLILFHAPSAILVKVSTMEKNNLTSTFVMVIAR